LTTTSTGVTYVGGFCTIDCSATGACPGQSQCVGLGSDNFGEVTFQAFCWPPCGAGNPCREPGYACYGLTQADGGPAPTGACWLDPPAPDGLVGSACNQDTDCYKPTGPGRVPGSCITQITDAGCDAGVSTCQSGWTGGYCIADCFNWAQSRSQATSNSYCGDGGVCLTFANGADICFEKCANPGVQDVCRTGYLCNSVPAFFLTPGRCFPDCRNPGWTCAAGTTCDAGICQ